VVWVLIVIKVGLDVAVQFSNYPFSDGTNKKGPPFGEPFLMLRMVAPGVEDSHNYLN
jgi:hypothetical protein